MNLSFPAVQPGTEEPRDLAYLQQLPAQPPTATPSVAAPAVAAAAASTSAAPTPAKEQPGVQQPGVQPPVTPPAAAQHAPLPPLEVREPSVAAPRAGVNSMFGL